MDLIDRQAAIDAIERNTCNTQRAIDAVMGLPSAQREQRWIPCSTRLPDEEQWDDAFLVTVQCEHVDGWPDYVVCGAEYSAYGWDYLPNPIGAIKAVAWMPINVEPYTERREE